MALGGRIEGKCFRTGLFQALRAKRQESGRLLSNGTDICYKNIQFHSLMHGLNNCEVSLFYIAGAHRHSGEPPRGGKITDRMRGEADSLPAGKATVDM